MLDENFLRGHEACRRDIPMHHEPTHTFTTKHVGNTGKEVSADSGHVPQSVSDPCVHQKGTRYPYRLWEHDSTLRFHRPRVRVVGDVTAAISKERHRHISRWSDFA